MSQRKKVQTIKAWGGFSDDQLYVRKSLMARATYDEPRYAVFLTKSAARRAYHDVRAVRILVEVKHAK